MRRAAEFGSNAVLASATVFALALSGAAQAQASTSNKSDDIARLNAAARVFEQVMATPDKAIPEEILQHATCIAIIPGEKKGAFLVGANYGKGVAVCRNTTSSPWNAPLFVTIGGGSYGFQIGVQSSDIVMVFGNRSQLDSLLNSKFRIGAEASAAAGPVGRHAAAATDVKLNSQILTYGRSKGAFAGVSISGAVVQPDTSGNKAMYGDAGYNVDRVLTGNGVPVPKDAEPLIRALDTNATTAPVRPKPTVKKKGGATRY
jgi:lipid-binding SYLF domain-containing protein